VSASTRDAIQLGRCWAHPRDGPGAVGGRDRKGDRSGVRFGTGRHPVPDRPGSRRQSPLPGGPASLALRGWRRGARRGGPDQRCAGLPATIRPEPTPRVDGDSAAIGARSWREPARAKGIPARAGPRAPTPESPGTLPGRGWADPYLTNAPWPWADSTRPSLRSSANALRTVVRVVPNRSASVCSLGSRSPGDSRRAKISSRRVARHVLQPPQRSGRLRFVVHGHDHDVLADRERHWNQVRHAANPHCSQTSDPRRSHPGTALLRVQSHSVSVPQATADSDIGAFPGRSGWCAQSRSTTWSTQAVSASTSSGSTAGNIPTRSWLRPSRR
jgi:hypothetical protein